MISPSKEEGLHVHIEQGLVQGFPEPVRENQIGHPQSGAERFGCTAYIEALLRDQPGQGPLVVGHGAGGEEGMDVVFQEDQLFLPDHLGQFLFPPL